MVFEIEVQKMWNVTVTNISVIIDALVTASNNLELRLNDKGIPKDIPLLQKTALFWGDYLAF